MRHAPLSSAPLAIVIAASVAAAAPAEFDVPSPDYPTLAAAVAAAAASLESENIVNLQSNVTVGATIDLAAEFNAGHRLLIRPDPAIGGIGRAAILSTDPDAPIFHMHVLGGGYVTLQDLDLLRNITNDGHLLTISEYSNVTIERCRLGSIFSIPYSSLKLQKRTPIWRVLTLNSSVSPCSSRRSGKIRKLAPVSDALTLATVVSKSYGDS